MTDFNTLTIIVGGSILGSVALVLACYAAVRSMADSTGIWADDRGATGAVSAPASPVPLPAREETNISLLSCCRSMRDEFLREAISLDERDSDTSVTVSRLDNVRAHRACLRGAFNQAERRVIVVSPFLSAGAVRADEVDTLVRQARRRGVEVIIFTDKSLNEDSNGRVKESCKVAAKVLEEAGAKIVVAKGVHHKTLIVDDEAIVDGSFNWLSAVRNERHPHFREERSTLVRGGGARRLVAQELRRLMPLCPAR